MNIRRNFYSFLVSFSFTISGVLTYFGFTQRQNDSLSYWSFDLIFITLGLSFIPYVLFDKNEKLLESLNQKIDNLTEKISKSA